VTSKILPSEMRSNWASFLTKRGSPATDAHPLHPIG
jgi:hypothetical protein